MISSYVIAILSVVAVVVIAGVTYLAATGKKNETIDKTKITGKD